MLAARGDAACGGAACGGAACGGAACGAQRRLIEFLEGGRSSNRPTSLIKDEKPLHYILMISVEA